MSFPLIFPIRRAAVFLCQTAQQRLGQWTNPTVFTLALNLITDAFRSRSELMVENALLRQRLIVLQRQVNRPAFKTQDRVLLVLLASKLRSWKHSLLIVQPDTSLRWHRNLFRRIWRHRTKSKNPGGRPPLSTQIVALIKQIAQENPSWGRNGLGASC